MLLMRYLIDPYPCQSLFAELGRGTCMCLRRFALLSVVFCLLGCQTVEKPSITSVHRFTSLQEPNPEIPIEVKAPHIQVEWIAGQKEKGKQDGVALEAQFGRFSDFLSLPNGDLLIADPEHHQIRRLSLQTKKVSSVLNETQQEVLKNLVVGTNLRSPDGLTFLNQNEILVRAASHEIVLKYNFASQKFSAYLISSSALSLFPQFDSNEFEYIHSGLSSGFSCLYPYRDTVYFCENSIIYRISKSGKIEKFLGGGVFRGDAPVPAPPFDKFRDGTAHEAKFWFPSGLIYAPSGSLYISDTQNHRIRIFDPQTHQVSTVVGQVGAEGFTELIGGGQDGALDEARLTRPGPPYWIEQADNIAFLSNGALRLIYKERLYTLLQGVSRVEQDEHDDAIFYAADKSSPRIYQVHLDLDHLLPYLDENQPVLLREK